MTTRRIVFIDSHIADYNILISQLQPDTEAVLLDEKQDGIEQILTALHGKSNLAAIDIISHGSPGSITLGSGVLNSKNLHSYTDHLFRIGQHLAEDGDILLYGCEVAKGESGLAFIEQLSKLTGSDVAASTSLTGATEMGGDWILDAQIGAIRTGAMAFNYNGVLVDDYPASTATTGSITIGSSSNGSLEAFNDRDWFRVSLLAGQTYEFRMNIGGNFHPNLAALNADGNPLFHSSVGGILIYTATYTGTHYLEAWGSTTSGIRYGEEPIIPSSYTISAIQTEDENNDGDDSLPDDYLNTINTTGVVSIDKSASGNIEVSSDTDWFQISLVAGQNYEFQLNSDSIDSFLTLYDPTGNLIIENDNGGTNLNSLIAYTASSTGTYYLEAKSVNANETGNYTVSAQTRDDYSDTVDTTGLLTVGGSVSGFIEESLDRDWFQISLTAGKTYKVQAVSEDITPYIALYDINGIFLDANFTHTLTQFGGDLDFTAAETGTYYLGVSDINFGVILRKYGRDSNIPEESVEGHNTGNYTISVLGENNSLLPADRIFDWAESLFPELLPNHPESVEIYGYYARIYDNGNAVGEQDNNLYFYDGNSIILVGAVDNFLQDAIASGF